MARNSKGGKPAPHTVRSGTGERSAWGGGSIQDLGDGRRWRLRYVVRVPGRAPTRKTATFEGTEAAAYRRIKELQASARTEGAGGRGNLAPFVARFLQRTRDEKAEGTARIYAAAAANHVLPRWGQVKVTEIARDDVRDWYTVLMTGRRAERAYSRNTLSGIQTVLRGALDMAKAAGLITENPAAFRLPVVRVEEQRRRARARRSMTPDQAAAFVAACGKHRGGSLLAFTLMTGCRIGEATALRWEDVNPETGLVRIHRTRSNGGKGGSYESPGKTAGAQRIIHTAGGPAHALLQAQVERLETDRAQCRPGWVESNYVFFTPRGGPYASTSIKTVQQKVCRAAGLPYFAPHELRHTAATLLLSAGADLMTTARLLGHSRASTTLDQYAHALPEKTAGLSALLGAQLEGD